MSHLESRLRGHWRHVRLSLLAAVVLGAVATMFAAPAFSRTVNQHHRRAYTVAATRHVLPRRLRSAAKMTHRADHHLVADARALKHCLAVHHGHAASCARLRKAVQSAGSGLARAESQLSNVAVGTSGHAPTATTFAAAPSSAVIRAPSMWVSGTTLHWTRIDGYNTYVFVRKVPGQPDQYSVVSGTSLTPPAVPGATVRYSVRAAGYGALWAGEVSISYPSEAPAYNTQAAPDLTVSGQSLHWAAVPGVNTFVFVRKVPGHADEYSVVSGQSITPAAVPGQTVRYSLRTAVEGSVWAPEVTISYPVESPPPSSQPEPPAPGVGGGGLGEPFVKGVNTNMQGWGAAAVPAIASEMSTLGVSWAREDLAWSQVESQPGVYNWTSFDQIVSAARANGLTVLPVVGYAPSWTGPENPAAYAEFVAKAVERYGPGTASNLRWWELWNEPNEPYAWSGQTPSAEGYARDVAAAAEAGKRVSATVKFLAAAEYNPAPQKGGSTQWETSWVNDMLTAVPNLGSLISGISVHPYIGDPALPIAQPSGWTDANGQWAWQRIDTIRSQFLAHGVNLPFWITEDGWSTRDVSEATQQEYYGHLVQQIALRPWIRALFPYCLREFQEHPTNDQSEYGLLRFGSWQPKAAFYTLKAGLTTLN